ncbi:hypothetical protein KFE25_008477 [Diacronema lutheri]|uniref:Uncharacterized protein n=1 Tax=Diacronema lutheri TaxID=2081491 RepID=A0A8J5XD93_DIALT|nr:hypothetical protein KFE25_008477 [Diacronema lutheri]
MADDDAGADGGGGSSAPAGVVGVSVMDQSAAAPRPSAPAAPRRAAPAERPVDTVDTTGEQFRKALAWIDQQPNPGQAVIAGVKVLQNDLNKKHWFKNNEGVYQRALGLRSDDKVTSTKNARLVVARFLVVYAPFRAAMGADLDAVAILPYGGSVDLAGDDDNDGDGVAESVLGWAPFQFGDAGNVSELVQRVGAMIKSLRCDFDLNNSTHKATLGGLVTAHGLTREVGNNRLEVNMDKWVEHGMATFRPAPPRKVSMIDAVARLVMVMRMPALQEELAQLRCGVTRNELDRKGPSTAHLLKSRDSPILKIFYDRSTTFEDPAGMAQETFLSDETLTPNPNQDFSQVDPARLYEEYVRVKAAIAVPAANWMKSGNNDAPFSNFCNDRLIAYIFHIFKESAKLGPDGRFTEILPGWFQALGGLAPDIGATASGARRSVVGAAGLARADLLVQRGVSPLKRGGCTARKAARSLPSDGGAEGVDAAALVIADAIRFSSAPPETTLSYLKGTLECAVMIEKSTDPRMQALYGHLLDKAGAAMTLLQPTQTRGADGLATTANSPAHRRAARGRSSGHGHGWSAAAGDGDATGFARA